MKHSFSRLVPKLVLGSLLALGLTTGLGAANAQPAQAGVVVSVGFGGGYAPGYHWHRWRDGYGWHRAWVPFGWSAPVAFVPAPVFYRPARAYRPAPVAFYGGPYDYRYRARWAYAHRDFHRER